MHLGGKSKQASSNNNLNTYIVNNLTAALPYSALLKCCMYPRYLWRSCCFCSISGLLQQPWDLNDRLNICLNMAFRSFPDQLRNNTENCQLKMKVFGGKLFKVNKHVTLFFLEIQVGKNLSPSPLIVVVVVALLCFQN